MKYIIQSAILVFLSIPVIAEQPEAEREVLKQAFPWIFSGDSAVQYKTVPLHEIHAYCAKNQGEMSVWYEEYKKKVGEIKDPEIPEADRRPENGLMSGVAALVQLNVTYYINKRASEGWRVVGASHDFFVFERSSPDKEKKAEPGTGQPATAPQLQSEGRDKPQPEAEGRSR